MSSSDFVYSNARVKSKEVKLLSEAQIARLSEVESLKEAYKLLTEYGYGAGTNELDFDRMFYNAEIELGEEFKELSVDESGLDAFLKMNDYHNLKSLLKQKATGQIEKGEKGEMFLADGLVSFDKLKSAVISNDYNALSDFMGRAIKEIDSKSLDGISPHTIDSEIDKAMFADCIETVKKGKQKELINYFVTKIDIANISAFLRAKKLDLPMSFFAEGFITDGNLDKDFYLNVYEQNDDVFLDKMRFTDYRNLIAIYNEEGLVRFEVESDNFLLKMFKEDRNEMFSCSPIAGYYLGKQTELKALKLQIAALKNNVDSGLIKQRMRELYA